ncbi:MAG: ZIP family metal transporter [Candidatus Dadabacteria bacterium]|nr:ZIP family metal transporter [Candidatus Dadabacteria bacterium]
MLEEFKHIAIVVIFLISVGSGFYPLLKREKARAGGGFPLGEAFGAGVFLALSLTLMLPAAAGLYAKAFHGVDYPLASAVVILAFLTLLFIEHWSERLDTHREAGAVEEGDSPVIAIIMTVMIAIPSFLLGVALGVGESAASVLTIFIAVVVHKGSASFAIALNLVRSRLADAQAYAIFIAFALMTPLGILLGEDIHQYLAGREMVVIKAIVLSLASGTFLFMSTMHGLRRSPLIEGCSRADGFAAMLTGVVLTALVRYVLGG